MVEEETVTPRHRRANKRDSRAKKELVSDAPSVEQKQHKDDTNDYFKDV